MSGNQYLDLTDADQALLEFAATQGETFTDEQSEAWDEFCRRVQAGPAEQMLSIIGRYRHHFEHDDRALKGLLLMQADISKVLCDHTATGEQYTARHESWADCLECETPIWKGHAR